MNKQKPTVSILYMTLGILFCVCLIAANVLETKQITVGPFELTAGVIVFPVSYIINDCLVEVWGFARARTVIWLGFIMNFLFVIFGFIADLLPGAEYWHGQEGFHIVFGLAPRITLASFIAFLAGSFMNAYVMSRMKYSQKGKYFSFRAIASTIAGESIDSIIFFPLALGGVVPSKTLPILMLSQVLLKTLYEIVILPVTIRVVKLAKKYEDMDVYDDKTMYHIFRF